MHWSSQEITNWEVKYREERSAAEMHAESVKARTICHSEGWGHLSGKLAGWLRLSGDYKVSCGFIDVFKLSL